MNNENKLNRIVKIVGIGGSIRKENTTKAAVKIVLQSAEKFGAETKLIELRDYNLPLVGSVLETDYPQDVLDLRREISEADGIILASPEYHGCLSGVLKNALDLMSSNEFEGKIIGLISVAGRELGGMDALNSLNTICRYLKAWTLPNQVLIPKSHSVFDTDGNILDQNIETRLKELGRLITKQALSNKLNLERDKKYEQTN